MEANRFSAGRSSDAPECWPALTMALGVSVGGSRELWSSRWASFHLLFLSSSLALFWLLFNQKAKEFFCLYTVSANRMSRNNKDGDGDRSRIPQAEDVNPFIAFRHLIDSHIVSALRMLGEEAGHTTRDEAPDETNSRLFGVFGQPPLYDRTMSRRKQQLQEGDEEGNRRSEEQQQHEHDERGCQHKGRARHRRHFYYHDDDHDQDQQKCRRERQDGGGVENRRDVFWPATSIAINRPSDIFGRRWSPLESNYDVWRLLSAYSPEQLVHDVEAPAGMQTRWHAAFLDLLALHNGEAMPSSSSSSAAIMPFHEARRRFLDSRDKHNLTWISPFGEHDRTISPLAAVIRHFSLSGMLRNNDDGGDNDDSGENNSESVSPAQKASQQDGHMSEEDMYRWFLGRHGGQDDQTQQRQQQQHQSRAVQADESDRHEQTKAQDIVSMVDSARLEDDNNNYSDDSRSRRIDEAASRSEIVATVTQSYTTTNSDGSSRTVRRFKKTFADGREECSEDVSEQPARQAQPEPEQPKSQRKSGWFWS